MTDTATAPTASPAASPTERRHDRVATVILTVGLVVLAAVALYLARGFVFVVDEWDILAHHVHGDLLTPYNGHLSLIPAGVYQLLAHTVGVGSYLPYFIVGLVVFLALPVGFHLTHRRVADPRLVALAALGIAWSWAAGMNIMYGFLVNFDLPLVMLVVAWWLIRRDSPGHDWATAATLAVALASSSIGVVVAFAVVVELLVARAPLRRVVRVAWPTVLWALWWVFRHEATAPASLGERVSYGWNMVVGILSGFTLGWKPGAVLSFVVIVAVVVPAARRGRVDAHVWAIGATILFFVVLSSFSRAGELSLNPPDASRYVWVGDLLIIAALLWCVRGRAVPTRALGAVAAAVVIGGVGLVTQMRDHRAFVLEDSARTVPFLLAAEAAGPQADRDRVLPLNLIPVTVGEYLDMVDAVGSPVAGRTLDDPGDTRARRQADEILIAEVGLSARVVDAGGCPGGTAASESGGDGPFELEPGASVVIAAGAGPVQVSARRFAAPTDPPELAAMEPRTRLVVASPGADRSQVPWIIGVAGDVASVTTCTPVAPPGGG